MEFSDFFLESNLLLILDNIYSILLCLFIFVVFLSICTLCLLTLIRPLLCDKLLCVSSLSSCAILLLLALGFLYGSLEYLIDIILLYFLLSFVGFLAYNRLILDKLILTENVEQEIKDIKKVD